MSNSQTDMRVTLEWADGRKDVTVCHGSNDAVQFIAESIREFGVSPGDRIVIEAVE